MTSRDHQVIWTNLNANFKVFFVILEIDNFDLHSIYYMKRGHLFCFRCEMS